MVCMDHIAELIVAIMPLLLALLGSHLKLNKDINCNNEDATKLTEEVKKLLAAHKEITRGD